MLLKVCKIVSDDDLEAIHFDSFSPSDHSYVWLLPKIS